jgi:hypothetical protein
MRVGLLSSFPSLVNNQTTSVGGRTEKTLATNAKMMREERRREGKGERRWVKNPSPVDGPTENNFATKRKTPNHRHIRQDSGTEPPPQTHQPKSRRPILAMSKKLIILS